MPIAKAGPQVLLTINFDLVTTPVDMIGREFEICKDLFNWVENCLHSMCSPLLSHASTKTVLSPYQINDNVQYPKFETQ